MIPSNLPSKHGSGCSLSKCQPTDTSPFSLGMTVRSAPCQTSLSEGKTPLTTKPVWLFLWAAKELAQLNDLMHLLVSLQSFSYWLFLSEMSGQRLSALLRQHTKYCYKKVSLLILFPFSWIYVPTSKLSENKYNRAPNSTLAGNTPRKQGKAVNSHCNQTSKASKGPGSKRQLEIFSPHILLNIIPELYI